MVFLLRGFSTVAMDAKSSNDDGDGDGDGDGDDEEEEEEEEEEEKDGVPFVLSFPFF